jgi:hypothetical protein
MSRYSLHHLWRALLITLALLPISTLPPASIKAAPAVSLRPIGLQATTVLYDGALNTGTPDTQGFVYLTNPLSGVQATQTFTNPVTTLDTTPQRTDYAGYFAQPTLYPPLDRARGYQVWFTAQVVAESHVSNDRAGFSLLVTSSDKRGIELGFWENEVWAQEGGSSQPFTHAEGAVFTTTSGLIKYRLSVLGNTYTLAADGVTILSGQLRDYTTAPAPPLPVNPYTTPNLIFLGDDTSAAQSILKLAAVSVVDAPPFSVCLPLIFKTSILAHND